MMQRQQRRQRHRRLKNQLIKYPLCVACGKGALLFLSPELGYQSKFVDQCSRSEPPPCGFPKTNLAAYQARTYTIVPP
nr:hypothetical protein Q903MT_gene722 [Picea sitchensis]